MRDSNPRSQTPIRQQILRCWVFDKNGTVVLPNYLPMHQNLSIIQHHKMPISLDRMCHYHVMIFHCVAEYLFTNTHYSDVTRTLWCLKSTACRLVIQQVVPATRKTLSMLHTILLVLCEGNPCLDVIMEENDFRHWHYIFRGYIIITFTFLSYIIWNMTHQQNIFCRLNYGMYVDGKVKYQSI